MFRAVFWLAPAAINPAWAAPQDGKVVSGQAGIGQDGKTTTITQSSDRVSIHWRSFGIAADETVQFKQPSASAIALNRVIGNDPSQIFGRLTANGRVYLINPNGILFGSGAQVNVGGLVASTLDIDDDSLSKNQRRFAGSSKASVTVEQGARLVADGGSGGGGEVALLGHQVINQGSIMARLGTVALGGGNDITLDFNGDRLLSLVVNKNELNAQVRNGGLIQADGGMVLMSAGARDSLLASVVNNNGILQAQSVQEREGKIVLLAGMAAGSTEVSGTLDASALLADGSNGGFIETSGAQVKVADGARISTRAASGKTGLWLIDPTDFTIAASGGDMTGATLAAQLANSNVEIQSTNGGSGSSGNIYVNDALSWSSGTGLTLNAIDNIYINSLIDASQGNGGRLVLKFGQGNANGTVTDSSGNPTTTLADYYLGANGRVNLKAGANFATQLGGEAQLEYTVITQLGQAGDETRADATNSLQGLGYSGRLGGNYVLGADIDASDTANWNDDGSGNKLGFKPIGKNGEAFSGRFHGLGHVIDQLSIQRPAGDEVGLFGHVANANGNLGGELRDIGLNRVRIRGRSGVGALVGTNYGVIRHSYAEGEVSASYKVGGLVGHNVGEIYDSFAAVAVQSTTTSSVTLADAGGLVGANHGGIIGSSYASGRVDANSGPVGGLVGTNSGGDIFDSYATGAVNATAVGTHGYRAGGLVGGIKGGSSISHSYATGLVSGPAAGGLVGTDGESLNGRASITDSYWKQGSAAAWAGGTTRATPPATALTAEQFAQAGSFSNFDFTNTWASGQATPQLRGVAVFRDLRPVTAVPVTLPSTPVTPPTPPTPPELPSVLRSITERRSLPDPLQQGLLQLASRCAVADSGNSQDSGNKDDSAGTASASAADCASGEGDSRGDGLLQVVGSGIRLPDRAATLLSDQDFE
jgi:filamentous hemagglutinin family protein